MRSTGTGTPNPRRRLVRTLSLTGAVAALVAPVLFASSSSGAPVSARPGMARAATIPSAPPNVT
ncbi:MAG: hypothetical protein ACR2K2_12440, partial [Mycobacteriales bacterium]